MSEAREGSYLTEMTLPELISELRLPESDPRASKAATEMLRRFQPLLRKYWAWHRLGDYNDFVQETLLRLFIALPKLRDPAAFPGLFRRIVIGTATDALRARQSEVPTVPMEFDEEMLTAEFDESISTSVVVRSLLEHLPPREREVVELAYLAELPPAVVASRMGLTEGAVRVAKSRAIARLRAYMAPVTKKISK